MTTPPELCACRVSGPSGGVETRLGVDATAGRYGECKLVRCPRCGSTWLHYLVEYEAFTGSGRVAMGPIAEADIPAMTPMLAVPYLDRLDWLLIGGSHWGGGLRRSRGPLDWS